MELDVNEYHLHMHLHGYCNAGELRYISQVGEKRPRIFSACNWHDFTSPRQESRGEQESVETHRVHFTVGSLTFKMSLEAATF